MINNLNIQKFYKGKYILVTGGTGLIGRQLVKKLCDLEANVVSVSLDNLKIDKRAKYLIKDLTQKKNCTDILNGIDMVFHVAGIKGSYEITKKLPASFMQPMLLFNTNLLHEAAKKKIKDLVFTSSIGAYSSRKIFKEYDELESKHPMDFYPGWAKRIAEIQIQAIREEYNLNWEIVRPSNIYGPGDNFDKKNAMVIPSLMSKIYNSKNKHIKVWGDGSAVRDFAFSGDIADGLILCMFHKTKKNFINLGSGKSTKISQLIKEMNRVTEFKYTFDRAKPNGFPKRVMDIKIANKLINYKPKTSLYDGLNLTWQWFINNDKEYLKRQNYFLNDKKN